VNNIIEFLMGITVGNPKNCKRGLKENSIECIQTWPMT
jgi:hypothetical protein